MLLKVIPQFVSCLSYSFRYAVGNVRYTLIPGMREVVLQFEGRGQQTEIFETARDRDCLPTETHGHAVHHPNSRTMIKQLTETASVQNLSEEDTGPPSGSRRSGRDTRHLPPIRPYHSRKARICRGCNSLRRNRSGIEWNGGLDPDGVPGRDCALMTQGCATTIATGIIILSAV